VAVLLSIEICESTTGEYKRTQQALNIGLGGVDGEGLVMWWMAEAWLCGGWRVMVEAEIVGWYSLVEYKVGSGRVLPSSLVPGLVIRII